MSFMKIYNMKININKIFNITNKINIFNKEELVNYNL